jgi:hypothetical protein
VNSAPFIADALASRRSNAVDSRSILTMVASAFCAQQNLIVDGLDHVHQRIRRELEPKQFGGGSISDELAEDYDVTIARFLRASGP